MWEHPRDALPSIEIDASGARWLDMRAPVTPVPVIPVGGLETASLLWRWREECHVTVAAKATFSLQHKGVMSPVIAEPFEDHELVPFRPATDVVVVAAHAVSERPVEVSAVRLVLTGNEPLIDKSLLVYAPRPGGVVAPFQRAAIATREGRAQALLIDPQNPKERGTLGRIDSLSPTLVDGDDGLVHLDDTVAWERFHAAPTDQRVSTLRGDEWLMLEGMTPQARRLQSRLPGALVETRVFAPEMWCGRSLVLHMAPCSVGINADELTCSLVWRGAFTVESAETARELTAVSAIHLPGTFTSWPTVDQVAAFATMLIERRRAAGRAATARASELSEERRSAIGASDTLPQPALPSAPHSPSRPPALEVIDAAPGGRFMTPAEESSPGRTVVLRSGKVAIRAFDRRDVGVSDNGTLDLPADRTELAPPASVPIGLRPISGAPWTTGLGTTPRDPSQLAAGGTIIADPDPPDLDERSMDLLEQTLSDSVDDGTDPISELFRVPDGD